jgi:hypothetical protein
MSKNSNKEQFTLKKSQFRFLYGFALRKSAGWTVIYSILLTDPNITTTEGLALGDSVETLTQIYGSNYTQQGSSRIYSGDAEQLILILQNDTVSSIEYRMIVK